MSSPYLTLRKHVSVSFAEILADMAPRSFCQSELGREYDNRVTRVIVKILARPTEVGARTLVYGASVGATSHGQYVPDCKIKPTGGLCKGEEGSKLQHRVWLELKDKLEGIRPYVTSLS